MYNHLKQKHQISHVKPYQVLDDHNLIEHDHLKDHQLHVQYNHRTIYMRTQQHTRHKNTQKTTYLVLRDDMVFMILIGQYAPLHKN